MKLKNHMYYNSNLVYMYVNWHANNAIGFVKNTFYVFISKCLNTWQRNTFFLIKLQLKHNLWSTPKTEIFDFGKTFTFSTTAVSLWMLSLFFCTTFTLLYLSDSLHNIFIYWSLDYLSITVVNYNTHSLSKEQHIKWYFCVIMPKGVFGLNDNIWCWYLQLYKNIK